MAKLLAFEKPLLAAVPVGGWISADFPPLTHELGGCAEPGQQASDEVLAFDEDQARRVIARYFPDGTWGDESSGELLSGVIAWQVLPEFDGNPEVLCGPGAVEGQVF